ncbi:hypothetical protein AOQ84DRAFT_344336, partial [Glonium stellatum]
MIEKVTANSWLLSVDIKQLQNDWDAVMKATPNEIWQPSISGFTSSDFWAKAAGATWKHLTCGSQEDHKAILIESQTSEECMELGLVKVLVPRNLLELSRYDMRCTIGWQASYEVWSLKTSHILFRLFLDLGSEVIQQLVSDASISHMEHEVPQLKDLEFQFPVIFGPLFRSVLILNYLVNVQEMPQSEQGPDLALNCRYSVVDIKGELSGLTTQATERSLISGAYMPSHSSPSRTDVASVWRNGGVVQNMAGLDLPVIQKSGVLIVGKNGDGLKEASMLRQNSDKVVLQTVTEDGTARQEVVSRVPRELLSSQPVLLRGLSYEANTQEITTVAWTKPPQGLYSFDEIVKEEHPVMLDRSRASIPTAT